MINLMLLNLILLKTAIIWKRYGMLVMEDNIISIWFIYLAWKNDTCGISRKTQTGKK